MKRVAVGLLCAGALLVGCKKKSRPAPSPSPTASASPTPAASPVETPAPTAAPSAAQAALPKAADIQHDKVYWGVYFALAPQDSTAFKDAQAAAKALGYEVFHKDPNCDIPVGEAPPPAADVGAENYLISVYFDSEADARKVATAYGTVIWVGQVKTMCLD